ncbi:MAG: hypothetical protein ACJAZN_000036, partial [Planctomycetota bacterium]
EVERRRSTSYLLQIHHSIGAGALGAALLGG